MAEMSAETSYHSPNAFATGRWELTFYYENDDDLFTAENLERICDFEAWLVNDVKTIRPGLTMETDTTFIEQINFALVGEGPFLRHPMKN